MHTFLFFTKEMDGTTFTELSDRLLKLEIQLNTSNEISITSQLEEAKKLIHKSIESQAELHTLNRITNELKLWDHLEEKSDKNIEYDSMDKESLILAKYPVIRESYSNLSNLSSMDIPKLINYIENSQDKVYDFAKGVEKISNSEEQIKSLTTSFHVLVVKNLIVLEKYVALMVRENEFWTTIENKLVTIQREAIMKADKLNRENKY